MQLRAFVLVCVAAICAAGYAQPTRCISLGGGLLTACATELDAVAPVYALDSDDYPTAEQIEQVNEIAASRQLPTETCCASVQAFDIEGCQCDATLPRIITQVGLTATTVGITGYVNLTRPLCGYTNADC